MTATGVLLITRRDGEIYALLTEEPIKPERLKERQQRELEDSAKSSELGAVINRIDTALFLLGVRTQLEA